MGVFVYTATEELVGGRSPGEGAVLDIDVQDSRRSRNVLKSVQRSDGGAMEVLKHRSEVTWSVTLEPVGGYRLDLVREFMASTEAGEAFTMDLYGTSAAPKSVKRIDSGYSEETFMRRGSEAADMFTVSFEVVEL